MDKNHTWNLGYWIIALSLLLLMQNMWQGLSQVQTVPYSEFEKALADGRFASAEISDRVIAGRLKIADGNKTALVENTLWRDLVSWVAPALVFFGLWFFLFRSFASRQGMGGFMSIGSCRAKIYVQTDTGVTRALLDKETLEAAGIRALQATLQAG